MKRYKQIVIDSIEDATREDMELLTCATDKFIEKMRQSHPEEVEEFLGELNDDLSRFLTYEEAKAYVEAMQNEDTDRPRGQMWSKEDAVKAFTSAGYPQETEKYNENEVYAVMNMVYSDFYPMYRENLKSYIDHAFLFLNDKDYKGRYSKAKWYFKK